MSTDPVGDIHAQTAAIRAAGQAFATAYNSFSSSLTASLTALDAITMPATPPPTPLPAPANVTAVRNSDGTISVAWAAVPGAARYGVAEDGTVLTTAVTTAGYTVAVRTTPGTYSYIVVAIDAAGAAGTPSAPVSVTVPAPSSGTITATATLVDSAHVRIDWSTTRTDVTGWTVGRNGTDSTGSPPWTSPVQPASLRTFQLGNIVPPGTQYLFTLTAQTPTANILTPVQLPASTGGGTGGGTADPGDGIQAATLQGWGAVQGGDEFTGDLSKWGLYSSAGHDGGRRVPSAFTIRNGMLVCTGLPNGDSGGMAYNGGGVGDAKLFRCEAQMQIVNVDSAGNVVPAGSLPGAQYHPVLLWWADVENWPKYGEVDYAETNVGANGMDAFIHRYGATSGGDQEHAFKALDLTQWHTYAVEQSSSGVKGWIDGVQWFSFTMSDLNGPPPVKMHPTIQLDSQGAPSYQQAEMRVRYLRIYGAPS